MKQINQLFALRTWALCTALAGAITAQAQAPAGVVISETSGATPDDKAILDVRSTTKGVLLPRLTETQKQNMGSPTDGMLIYQTNGTAGFYYRENGVWKLIASDLAASIWTENGGDIYYNGGNVGIGTTAPANLLEINSANNTTEDAIHVTRNGNQDRFALELNNWRTTARVMGGSENGRLEVSLSAGNGLFFDSGNTVPATSRPEIGVLGTYTELFLDQSIDALIPENDDELELGSSDQPFGTIWLSSTPGDIQLQQGEYQGGNTFMIIRGSRADNLGASAAIRLQGSTEYTTGSYLTVGSPTTSFFKIAAQGLTGVNLAGEPKASMHVQPSAGSTDVLLVENGSTQDLLRVEQDGDVKIGSGTAEGALDVQSTTGAFIVPRMTGTAAASLPLVSGSIIYVTSAGPSPFSVSNVFYFCENGSWVTK